MKISKRLRQVVLCLSALSLGAPCLGAAGPAADRNLAAEIEKLTIAVERLADQQEAERQLAEQHVLSRKLDTAIAYLNFRSRRIEMLEQDLQEMRVSRNQMDTILMQMDEKGRLLEADARSGTIGSSPEAVKARREHELRIKLFQERMEQMDQEMVLLENKIQGLQGEISSVESFVQRHLEF